MSTGDGVQDSVVWKVEETGMMQPDEYIEHLERQLAECQERERGLVDKANGYLIENARLTEQLFECQENNKLLH